MHVGKAEVNLSTVGTTTLAAFVDIVFPVEKVNTANAHPYHAFTTVSLFFRFIFATEDGRGHFVLTCHKC